MMPLSVRFCDEFFAKLEEIDAAMAAQVAAARCSHCGGPLHQANYLRKPRGGAMAGAGEASCLRHSLCCGRRGCRRRALPPSLRFLGRRVYLEVVVVLASVAAMVQSLRAAAESTEVPARTLGRWGQWWREEFPLSQTWIDLRARFIPPPPDEAELPKSLLERLHSECGGARDPREAAMVLAARLLAPATTSSVEDAARFVRVAWAASCP